MGKEPKQWRERCLWKENHKLYSKVSEQEAGNLPFVTNLGLSNRQKTQQCSVPCALLYHNSFFLKSRYVYKLEATTGGGSSPSDEYIIQTPILTPEQIQPPCNITVIGPYSIFVAWTPPGKI